MYANEWLWVALVWVLIVWVPAVIPLTIWGAFQRGDARVGIIMWMAVTGIIMVTALVVTAVS